MEKISCIYEIVNKVNDHRYIGSTAWFKKRKRVHISLLKRNKHHSLYMQNAWNKYGAKNFIFKIVEECSIEKLIEREQFYIDTQHPEYNILQIAGSSLGYKHTKKAKNKISAGNTGRKRTEEVKKRMSESQRGNTHALGYKHTEEAKKKMVESCKGRPPPNSILTEKIVLDLRKQFKQKDNTATDFCDEAANEYGVTTAAIQKVVYRQNWKHVV